MNMTRKLNAVSYLGKTYITAIPRIIYRSTISIFLDPNGVQKFVHQVLNAQDLESDDAVLGSAEITGLIGGEDEKNYDIDISIIGPYYHYEQNAVNILLELAVLTYLMRRLRPQLVFEIGTFLGRTTRLFALNSPPDCKVLTLDLPQTEVKHIVGANYYLKKA